MTHALILSDDLIFASKIAATAKAHGLSVKQAKTLEALLKLAAIEKPSALILELDHSDFSVADLLKAVPVKAIAYGSHVDAERLKEARRAGCAVVLPRSAFVERLEAELPQWLVAEGYNRGSSVE